MSFGLITSESALLPSSTGALKNFSAATTVRNVRLTNVHTIAVTATLWFDYDGTSTGDVDMVLDAVTLGPGESVKLDGELWNFANGGRISGLASVANKITMHFSQATI